MNADWIILCQKLKEQKFELIKAIELAITYIEDGATKTATKRLRDAIRSVQTAI
jgi:hypothetical protein